MIVWCKLASCFCLVNGRSGTWRHSGSVCARAGGCQIFKRLARHQEPCLCHLFSVPFCNCSLGNKGAPSTPAAPTLISIMHSSLLPFSHWSIKSHLFLTGLEWLFTLRVRVRVFSEALGQTRREWHTRRASEMSASLSLGKGHATQTAPACCLLSFFL